MIDPQIGDIIAEFENRVSYLEQSSVGTLVYELEERLKAIEEKINLITNDKSWSNQQWDAVQQAQVKVMHLENKLNEHLDATKKKKQQQ